MEFREDKDGNLVFKYGPAENFASFLGLKRFRRIRYLYKYASVSDYLIDSISNGYLWFSRPRDFNDPFDCKMIVRYDLDPKIRELRNSCFT